jgi:3-methyladenine DNA glycosylase/8-oxoguanine DNA glycosylase
MTDLPTEAELLELAEHRRPYRSLAVSYLFASEFEPKGDPR